MAFAAEGPAAPDREADLGDRAEAVGELGDPGSQHRSEFPIGPVGDAQRHDQGEADRGAAEEMKQQRRLAGPAAVEGENFPAGRHRLVGAEGDVGPKAPMPDQGTAAAFPRLAGAGRLQERRRAGGQALGVEAAVAVQFDFQPLQRRRVAAVGGGDGTLDRHRDRCRGLPRQRLRRERGVEVHQHVPAFFHCRPDDRGRREEQQSREDEYGQASSHLHPV
jgi:hypothetical protein